MPARNDDPIFGHGKQDDFDEGMLPSIPSAPPPKPSSPSPDGEVTEPPPEPP